MSKISAEFSGNELIIKKIERHRKGDNDTQRVNLVDLVIIEDAIDKNKSTLLCF